MVCTLGITHDTLNRKLDAFKPALVEGMSSKTSIWNRIRSFQFVESYSHVPSTFFIQKRNKIRGFSPQANYTDRATAVFRRS
jgi:hypothetical protein